MLVHDCVVKEEHNVPLSIGGILSDRKQHVAHKVLEHHRVDATLNELVCYDLLLADG